jgi:hypothetical protein
METLYICNRTLMKSYFRVEFMQGAEEFMEELDLKTRANPSYQSFCILG